MRRFLSFFLALLHLLSPATAAFDSAAGFSPDETAKAIKTHYESRLEELRPAYQGHWVLRLYRITGDSRYLTLLKPYGGYLKEEFAQWVGALHNPILKAQKIEELLGPPRKMIESKYAKRRRILAESPDYLYMHQLLFLTFMMRSLGLNQQVSAAYQIALEALRAFSFRPYLSDKALLLYNSAEMANDLYFLKILGIDDFENDFLRIFKELQSETEGSEDPILFENKIYGMTHMIIAASEYYQKSVSPETFGWILDFFSVHIDMILPRVKPDVAAEVGVCFLLTGLPDHPVVAKTRRFVSQAWDPASGIIPSIHGDTDLNRGEHRNALAFMLLAGFQQLHPGPELRET